MAFLPYISLKFIDFQLIVKSTLGLEDYLLFSKVFNTLLSEMF